MEELELSSRYAPWILERGFGGMGAAVSPISTAGPNKWPDGPSAPCSREACAALVQACNGPNEEDEPRCIVLLVGGAGNGKSKLAADTVEQVDGVLQGGPSKFARRKYSFDLANGSRLQVVNDATIPPEDKHPTPLLRDLADAILSRDHLLVCVNRGVLISEASASLPDGSPGELTIAKALASWLLDGSATVSQENQLELEILPAGQGGAENYGHARLLLDGSPMAVFHVVYMDQASLLERWSEEQNMPEDPWQRLNVRGVDAIPLLSDERASTPTAFERSLTAASRSFVSVAGEHPLDPVFSNARSLSMDLPARGWCSVMRGAEIISGTQFTYRELWALFAHSLVGPCTAGGLETLARDIETWIDIAQSDVDGSLEALVALGNMRTHMLLFDAGNPSVATSPTKFRHPWPVTTSEALKSLASADPLRQFGPSSGKEYLELADKLARIEDNALPVAELADEDDAVGQYWSDLDARIEAKISEAVNPENDSSSLKGRNALLSWYGRYMYRLVAFARGWPAHCSVVNRWQHAWIDAREGRAILRELEDAILDIIAPLEDRHSEAYFTLMKSRVVGNSRSASVAEIEVQRNHMRVHAEAFGDRLEIAIDPGGSRQGPGKTACTALDFHLLREALSRFQGKGFTDSLELIEPRIERLRASLVSRVLASQESRVRFRFSKLGMGSVTR